MNSLSASACLSAELGWLTFPAARKHFMEANIWRNSISPKTTQALKTIFFAKAENRISPNQMKVNRRSPTFVANLTAGYNFEVESSLRVFGGKKFLITENSIGTEGNL